MLKADVKTQTVVASYGKFEEHPESYSPRIFVRSLEPTIGDPAGLIPKVYELLRDGQAIVWPYLPVPSVCKFDYWLIDVTGMYNVDMVRYGNEKKFVTGTNIPIAVEHVPDTPVNEYLKTLPVQTPYSLCQADGDPGDEHHG